MRILNWFVKNFRMGLATNSSSSHSLVYFTTPRYDTGGSIDSEGWEEAATPFVRGSVDVEFGWGMFKLDTLYEKLMYALVNRLQRAGYTDTWGSDDEPEKGYEEFGHLFPELTLDDFREAAKGYIDHQSSEDTTPDQVLKAARDPHVEIWGGNDNGGDPHEDYYNWQDGSYAPRAGIEKVERL